MRTILFLWLAWQGGAAEALLHMQAGAEARNVSRLDDAVSEFRKATEADPRLADAFINLGEAFMAKHDYGAAIAPLKRALELNPDSLPAHDLLGFAFLAQGYAADAIPHLTKANELGALGIAQMETGDLTGAVANLNAALSKQPNDPDLLYYLGRAGGLLSKQSIDALLAAYPDSARAHQALAENYFVLRQMPQAESEYRAALRLRPALPNLHLELGLVYAGAADWAMAENEFREETRLQPGKAEAAYRLGTALLQQGKVKAAHSELRRANLLKPDMPEVLYSLGKAASQDGDAAGAESAWKRMIELEPQSALTAQAHFALAEMYRKQGKSAEAAREVKEFRRLRAAGSAGAETGNSREHE